MICSVEGCNRPLRYKKIRLCSLHYQRNYKHGDPLAGGNLKGAPLKWLHEHVDYAGDECLMWPFGRSSNGYGCLRTERRKHYAHRLMCQLAHGEASGQVDAAHSCGNGRQGCVNPRHLRWASRYENMQDAVRAGTHSHGKRHSQAMREMWARKREAERSAYINQALETLSQWIGTDVATLKSEGQAQFGEAA